MLESHIQLLPVILAFNNNKLRYPLPTGQETPMDIEWDNTARMLTLRGTKSDASASIKLKGDTWKFWSNSAFSFIHESLAMEPFAFIKHLMEQRIKATEPVQPEEPVSCRSYDGVTQGLVDSMITIARVLRHRELHCPIVREALKDFHQDEDIRHLMDEAAKA